MDNSIKKGVEIRNKIGSSFKEVEMLRKGIWANTVLTDKLLNQLDDTYVRKFNDFDVVRAKKYQEELIAFNITIEEMLGIIPAEQDPEINPDYISE